VTVPRIFVIDTNVLVAGLISGQGDSPTVQIVDAMLDGRLIYLLSPVLLQEYRGVLLRPKLLRLHGLDEGQIDHLLTEITANAIWRETISEGAESAPDPGDDHLWKLLATEPSAVLVTGDRLLCENPPTHSSVIYPASCIQFFLE
jgi:putative PIN family toxin of toxin-antitoxin system